MTRVFFILLFVASNFTLITLSLSALFYELICWWLIAQETEFHTRGIKHLSVSLSIYLSCAPSVLTLTSVVPPVGDRFREAGDVHQAGQTGRGEAATGRGSVWQCGCVQILTCASCRRRGPTPRCSRAAASWRTTWWRWRRSVWSTRRERHARPSGKVAAFPFFF